MSNPPDEFLNKVKQVEKLIKNFEASECTEDMKRHQTTVDQTCDKYFKEQMETIQKLEKDLELLKIMESKSVQDYNDSINQHKACIEDENTLEICLEKQGDNFDQLNREIELLEEQIHKLDDDYTDDFNPYEMITALFRGLGVHSKEREGQVTEFELESYDKQHIVSLDLTKYSDSFITSYIWKRLSIGIDMK